MSKTKSIFYCQNCGNSSPKWVGKCTSCEQWNTFQEEVVVKSAPTGKITGAFRKEARKPIGIEDITSETVTRIVCGDSEFNRILGGGIVPGSLILFGGEPGIGKSTLMLQIALKSKGLKVIYVAGEESSSQVKMRGERIGLHNPNCSVLSETNLQNVLHQLSQNIPELVIVDSIQTLYSDLIESSPGSVSQVRECASALMRFARENSCPVCLIGHITKDGSLAGPKVLEHLVDTVLQFEGDRHYVYRLVRTIKNRFGSSNELGIYEMGGNGLREVSNPSEILITHRESPVSGVAIGGTMEGLRPLMIEIQALVSSAAYGTPQRSPNGFDLRRLNMLLAVLEKRCGFLIGTKDVFLNIAGGIKVEDPGIDLAVISAILSSSENLSIAQDTCFAAEVGLTGEIRPVNRIEQRLAEAEKLGFKKAYISSFNYRGFKASEYKIKIIPVEKIEDVFSNLFS